MQRHQLKFASGRDAFLMTQMKTRIQKRPFRILGVLPIFQGLTQTFRCKKSRRNSNVGLMAYYEKHAICAERDFELDFSTPNWAVLPAAVCSAPLAARVCILNSEKKTTLNDQGTNICCRVTFLFRQDSGVYVMSL